MKRVIAIVTTAISLLPTSACGSANKEPTNWIARVEGAALGNGQVTMVYNGKPIHSGDTHLPYEYKSKERPVSKVLLIGIGTGMLTCTITQSRKGSSVVLDTDTGPNKVTCEIKYK